ncbi:LysR family transcriptional regulator [Rhodococcus sp. SRB_17]|nr:LysR family transcriptional regulator [Rhodococcus sp. SRB_17]
MSEPLIDMRAWKQFAAVAQELHFGRAAQRLHMTQPPLTQAIAGLEKKLGLRLFDRNKRSVQLTAAGRALLPQVLDLLERAQLLPGHARAAAAGELGRLRLAFVSTVGFGPLPQWVRAFRAELPGVQLELIEATGDVQLEALQRGDIDAGLLLHAPGQAPPALERLRVASEPLVLALPEHHALATGAVLDWAALLDEPLVIFPRRILVSLYDAIAALYHAAGREPRVAQEAIQMQTIVNLVSAELGVAWVPASVRQFQRPGVVYREVPADAGVPHCETSLVWRDAAPSVPALARWIDFVRAALPVP